MPSSSASSNFYQIGRMADTRCARRCYPERASTYREEGRKIRILVALEDDYRAYQDVIAVGIRILRPRTDVETADLKALDEKVKGFQPQVVICSRPEFVDSGGWDTWVELSVDPTLPTKVSAGGRCYERTNPTLEELLGVLDEIEQLT